MPKAGTVHSIAKGPGGLGDRRNQNAGAKSLLDEEDKAALNAALTEPPADGGLWTGPKVAAWMTARLGRKIWPQRGWDYLQKLGYRSQVPRPRHAKAASAAEQEAFKRGSRAEWTSAAPRTPRGRSRSGRSTVESGAFNRVGLKPILRRQWAPKGQRPIAVGQHRYAWLYLHGFVHPSTGAVVWFVCSTVDTDLLSAVLAAFGQAVGAGKDKLVGLVLDQAGWHVSDRLVVPDGIVLEFLPTRPSCSPPSACGR